MKVRGPDRPIPLDVSRAVRTRADRPPPGTTQTTERVRVSGEARTLLAAREPEVPDRARIARLREAIAGGRFRIDADRIAEAMLREEL